MQLIYHPAFYKDCIKAVNKMSAFDSNTNTYKVTTTPQLMGTLLKKVGNLLITKSIMKKDYDIKMMLKNFLLFSLMIFKIALIKPLWKRKKKIKEVKKRSFLQWMIL